MHLEYAYSQLAYFNEINDPPRFVMETPVLFDAWIKWAKIYKAPSDNIGTIKPLGEKVGPGWLRFEFENVDDFYGYYIDLLKLEKEKETEENAY